MVVLFYYKQYKLIEYAPILIIYNLNIKIIIINNNMKSYNDFCYKYMTIKHSNKSLQFKYIQLLFTQLNH